MSNSRANEKCGKFQHLPVRWVLRDRQQTLCFSQQSEELQVGELRAIAPGTSLAMRPRVIRETTPQEDPQEEDHEHREDDPRCDACAPGASLPVRLRAH